MPGPTASAPASRLRGPIAGLLLALAVGAAARGAEATPTPLRVVLDDNYPPYAFRDSTGQLQGIVKDRWALWQARTGIPVEVLAMDWAKAQATMQAGGADVIDTIFRTPSREGTYAFSQPYADLDVALIFNRSISGITDAASARGFQVAVKAGDACIEYLHQHGVADLKPYPSYQTMVEAAAGGEIKMMCIDAPPAQYLLHRERVDDQFRLTRPLFTGQFHWAVRKGDEALRETIERGFALISEAELAQVDNDWKGSALSSMAWSERLRYGLYGLLGCVALSAFLVGWTLLLRRQVATKTRALQRALTELEASKIKFQALFERATDAILLMSGERCVDCNERASLLYRVSRKGLIGTTPLDFSPACQPDGRPSRDHLLELLERVRGGEVVVFEWQNQLADGSLLNVEVSWSQILVQGIEYQQAIVRDIGPRKQVERELDRHRHHLEELVQGRTKELAASEQRFRGLVEQSLVGIDIIQDGRFRYVNQAFADIFGYRDPQELLSRAIETLLVPEDRARVFEALRLRLTGEHESTQFEATGLRKDGSRVGIEVFGRRIEFQGRQATIAIVVDVSRRRALEAARELSLQEAEHLARVRSEFLANMSHEIRTPLNGVLGLARMGARTAAAGSAERAVFVKIVNSGMLLLGVLNDVLDFSKIEAGLLALESVVIDLPALLDESLHLVEENAAVKDVALQVACAPGLPEECLGDPLRLKQVLMNLLSNAVKFTHHGSVTLGAELQHETLVLSVSDTGIGIAPEEIATLFKAFHQADTSTTRMFGGTGLGLAICKRLVDLMDGEIRVDSRPGAGSRFEVRLPWQPASVGDLRRRAAAPPDGPRLVGCRLLVAEDNEVNQLVIDALLGDEGAELTLVGNGRDAVAEIRRHGARHFDAVLMDIQMPVMDGHQAARLIHAFAPELPIIGQTAHALQEDRDKCHDAGMVDHIAKPFEPEALVDVLRRHIRPRD